LPPVKFKIGMMIRLIVAIGIGVLLGLYAPEFINRVVITLSGIFGSFLLFVIPLMILAFVTMGIADLTKGAGKLLAFSAALAYSSTVITGSLAYLGAVRIFPRFIDASLLTNLSEKADSGLHPYFTFPIPPIMAVTSAIVLAFILGVCISRKRATLPGSTLYNIFSELSEAITSVLRGIIIPFLPIFICGTFVNLTVSGSTFVILSVLWKVFLTVIIFHLLYLLFVFSVAGFVTGRRPFRMMKNQIPGYLSAFGTQSSAATIPVNLQCAEANGVSKEIGHFVIPLFANIHMPGSMTTITCCVTAVLLMFDLPIKMSIIVPFILTLGFAMMASPGAPGGSIMSALPFLPLVGIASDSTYASLLISLYLTQDSFGTACNVSGDNAMAAIIDMVNNKFIKQKS
jgi:Na+/H+-dicarboxylate symporter